MVVAYGWVGELYRMAKSTRILPMKLDPGVRSILKGGPDDASVDLFEYQVGELLSAFGSAPAQLPERSRLAPKVGRDAAHFVRDLMITQQMIGRRLCDLSLDLRTALNDRRILAAILVGRSLLESAALAVYSAERLGVLTKQAPKGSYVERTAFIHRINTGGRFPWSRLKSPTLLGEYAKAKTLAEEPKPPEAVTAFNVLTMIQRLDSAVANKMPSVGGKRGLGVVRATYAIMSDFCHPAVGSSMIYFRPGTAIDAYVADSFTRDEQLRWTWAWLSIVPWSLACARDAFNSLTSIAKAAVSDTSGTSSALGPRSSG